MSKQLATKPRLRQTAKAVWECADAHLVRSGRSWKQAYDRWLLASLREAAAAVNLCPPAAPKAKKTPKRRKQIREVLHLTANRVAQVAPVETGGKTLPTSLSDGRKAGPQHEQGFAASTAKASGESKRAINQPAYRKSEVRTVAGVTQRPAYKPSIALMRNMDRAALIQKPLISISTGDRSAS